MVRYLERKNNVLIWKKVTIYYSIRLYYTNLHQYVYEPGHEKTYLMPYANNKGADQSALRAVCSAPLVFAASIVPILAKSKISRL